MLLEIDSVNEQPIKMVVQQGRRRPETRRRDTLTRPTPSCKSSSFPVGYVEDAFETGTHLEAVFSSRQKYHATPPKNVRGFPGTIWMSLTGDASFLRCESNANIACSHFVLNRF